MAPSPPPPPGHPDCRARSAAASFAASTQLAEVRLALFGKGREGFFRGGGGQQFAEHGAFFVDATNLVGLRVTSRRFTRFGMAMIDFDDDGRLDLYEANGRVGLQGETFAADPYAEPNLLFRGLAGAKFEEVTPRGGTASPLIATSRAAAFGDLDNDGGVDVVVANRDGGPHVLRNVAPNRGHWASFTVRTSTGRDALGAVLTIRAGGRSWRRDVRTAYSYLAANDPRAHVGLALRSR